MRAVNADLPLGPEARALLLAIDPEVASERMLAAVQACDADVLLAVAALSSAASTLWRRVAPQRAQLDAEVATRLERLARVSDFSMLYLEDRLAQGAAALREAGVPVMLLKGAALAERYYGSYEARPMGDIDLLVPADQLQRARECLLGAGWRWNRDAALDGFYAGLHHLPPLDDARGSSLYVELHRALFFDGHPFAWPVDALWARAERLERGVPGAFVPDPHDLLLHLCLHFAWSHLMRYGSWRALSDVRTVAASGRIDWDELARRARAARAGSCCYWTLSLARQLVDADVPDETLRALQPPLTRIAGRQLTRHFAAALFPSAVACPSVQLQNRLWELAIQPGWSGHGRARPWDRTDEYRPTVSHPKQPVVGLRKAMLHVRNSAVWARYASMVLTGAS